MSNPGKLDRRITIQSRTYTRDAAGGRSESWADVFDCWAEAVVQKANESVVSNADRSSDTRQFRIRYKANLSSGNNRVLYQLKFYDITGITEEGRQNTLLLDCRSVQSLTNI